LPPSSGSTCGTSCPFLTCPALLRDTRAGCDPYTAVRRRA